MRDVKCVSKIEEMYLLHNSFGTATLQNTGKTLDSGNAIVWALSVKKSTVFDISYTASTDVRLASTRCKDGFDLNFDISDDLPNFPVLQPITNAINDTASPLPNPNYYSDVKLFSLPSNLRYLDVSQTGSSGRDSWSRPFFFNSDNNLLYLSCSGSKMIRHFNCLVVGLSNVLSNVVGLSNVQVWDASHGMLQSLDANTFRYMSNLIFLNMSNNAFRNRRTDCIKSI